MKRKSLLFVLVAVAAGCSAGDADADTAPTGPAYTERDSAGYHIIENNAPVWSSASAWQIDSVPALTIGQEEGESEYLFNRIVGAARLSDGRIAIMDEGSSELRYYDTTGHYLMKLGRKGEGPGEFRRAEDFVRRGGDTIVIYDVGFGGISTVVGDKFVHHTRGNPDGMMRVIGLQNATEHQTALADGSVIIHATHRGSTYLKYPERTLFRLPVGYYRMAAGKLVDTLGWYDHGLAQLRIKYSDRDHFMVAMFPAIPSVAADRRADAIYLAGGDSLEILRFATGGDRAIIRRNGGLRPIPEGARQNVRDQLLGTGMPLARQTRGQTEELLNALPEQKYFPAISGLIVDDQDMLWVGRGGGYDVFDTKGRWQGNVRVRGKALDIGRDYVLTMTMDSLQIEKVHLYRLTRK